MDKAKVTAKQLIAQKEAENMKTHSPYANPHDIAVSVNISETKTPKTISAIICRRKNRIYDNLIENEVEQEIREAVSYTHLTLPTILLV